MLKTDSKQIKAQEIDAEVKKYNTNQIKQEKREGIQKVLLLSVFLPASTQCISVKSLMLGRNNNTIMEENCKKCNNKRNKNNIEVVDMLYFIYL